MKPLFCGSDSVVTFGFGVAILLGEVASGDWEELSIVGWISGILVAVVTGGAVTCACSAENVIEATLLSEEAGSGNGAGSDSRLAVATVLVVDDEGVVSGGGVDCELDGAVVSLALGARAVVSCEVAGGGLGAVEGSIDDKGW